MNRIKDLRTSLEWKQEDLAQRLKVSKVSVSRYELEQRQLTPDIIEDLCTIFDVSADYLLCRSDVPNTRFTKADASLLLQFRELNEEGKEKVLSYLGDLVMTGAYKKGDESKVVDIA